MIHTWLADVSALHDKTVYRKYYESVPEHRRIKADALKNQEDKALSVGAWILLMQMEKEYSLQRGFKFNISHSGNCAICTIDTSGDENHEVGCDIEKIGEERPGVAERYFCPGECEMIHSAEDFYRFWVLKESFMKATRMGMKLPMNSYEFAFTEGDVPYLKRQPVTFPKKYYFKEYTMRKLDYKIAVCADCAAFAEEIKSIKL